MRRISPTPPCPAALDPDGSPGAEERARAIAHFTGDRQGKFTFSAYQDDEVREALLEAFGRVCAYCEGPLSAIEVEHYRPKGRVQTADGRREHGYYWLAATWENLLPSCHHCNTDLWTEHPDGSRRKTGKGSWFPLEDESARATAAGEEANERPLLLHPYDDEPEEHLEFVEDGVVRARRGPDGRPSPRGEATIDRLGLNRRGLVDARRDRQLVVKVMLRAVKDAERRHLEDPDDAERKGEYDACVSELGDLLEQKAGFSGMAAQMVEVT